MKISVDPNGDYHLDKRRWGDTLTPDEVKQLVDFYNERQKLAENRAEFRRTLDNIVERAMKSYDGGKTVVFEYPGGDVLLRGIAP